MNKETIKLEITGMTCDHCATGIEKLLSKNEGISDAKVSYPNGSCECSFDPTKTSKEAIVNLIKIKSDVNDKMAKIADLRTRIKLKEKDTYPRYLAAQQNNVVIEGSKREMIKTINKLAQRKKNDKSN